jgi:hypothetical protein
MSASGFDLGLADPARAGVYFVTGEDLAPLAAAARDAGLLALRVDLAGCTDKPTLLLRIATALDVPGGRGRNWDGLADDLRDLDWLPASGYALLFDAAGDLRAADEADFDTLLDLLDQAAGDWARRETPFWAFLALPDDAFDELERAVEADA